jgi:hypothetical protein
VRRRAVIGALPVVVASAAMLSVDLLLIENRRPRAMFLACCSAARVATLLAAGLHCLTLGGPVAQQGLSGHILKAPRS